MAADLTYDEHGASLSDQTPPGAVRRQSTSHVSDDPTAFGAAADALLGWGLQRAAGLRVVATSGRAVPGTTVLSVTPGPVALVIPCRVVLAVEEEHRRGYVYGTLPGHPLAGEETFTVELEDDRVVLRLASFSRLVGLPRLVPPAARRGQRLMNAHYGRVARRLVPGSD